MSIMKFLEKYNYVLLFLSILLATWISGSQLQIKPIVGDASQNAEVSYYLATEGIYSTDGTTYWNKREPLPNFLNALYLNLFTSIDENDEISSIIKGNEKTLEWIKINLIYLFLLLLAIWWSTYELTNSHLIACLTLPFPYLFYSVWPPYLHSFHTELLASLIVILIAGTSIKFYKNSNLGWSLLCGIMLALFALTKAAGLYIAIVYIPILVAGLYFYNSANVQKVIVQAILIFIGFGALVFPWMYRNYIHFNEFTISERGGNVLLIRAVKNEMSSEEFKGAFYYYSPTGLRSAIFENFLGFSDKEIKAGGKYQRLNRDLEKDVAALQEGRYDDLITYYRIGKYKLPQELEREQSSYSGVENARFELAKDMIKSNPLLHLKSTIAFAWRGIWAFGDLNEHLPKYKWIGHINWLFNLICFISFITVFILSIIQHKPYWFALALFAIGLFCFHATLTHFIPRYSVPIVPIMNICFVLLAINIIQKGYRLLNLKYTKI